MAKARETSLHDDSAGSPRRSQRRTCLSKEAVSFGVLTYLLLVYCPGGVQEKQTLLRNLEEPGEIQSMADAPAAIRRWMRWRKRTEEVGAIFPDPTILLKGLNRMMKKLLEGHRELQFSVSLIRSTLVVDTAPSKENIEQLAHRTFSLRSTSWPTPTRSPSQRLRQN